MASAYVGAGPNDLVVIVDRHQSPGGITSMEGKRMVSTFVVEPMQVEDIPQVTEIERECFPTMWPSSAYKRELQNRMARYMVAVELVDEAEKDSLQEAPSVAASQASESPTSPLNQLVSSVKRFIGGRPQSTSVTNHRPIVGFVGLWYMMDEAHITTIGVRERCRRRGLGELLMQSAIQTSMELGCQRVTLEVRASNLGAQALYEKHGFHKTGLRRRYYSDNGEDAVIMGTERITSASYQCMLQQLKSQTAKRLSQETGLPVGSPDLVSGDEPKWEGVHHGA